MSIVRVGSRVLAVSGVVVILASCWGPTAHGGNGDGPVVTQAERAVSIEIQNPGGPVVSFSADVSVFTENDRIAGSNELVERYRLSVKEIGGQIYQRFDYEVGDDEALYRSVVASSTEVVFLNDSSDIVARIPVDDSDVDAAPFHRLQVFLDDVDVPTVQRTALDLNLDVAEDSDSGLLTLSFRPAESITGSDGNRVIERFQLIFDTVSDQYLGSEVSVVEQDGTQITMTENMVYQTVGDQDVVVATVRTTHHDVPGTLETGDEGVPRIDDPESVPEISQEDLDTMVDDGEVLQEFEPLIGDPADPDFTITEVEMYDNISLNEVDDETFRVVLE